RKAGVGENTEPCGSSRYTHGLEHQCVGNQPALLVKISVQFKPATQVWMHDLRQRHCPIIMPTQFRVKSRILFGCVVNRSAKLPQEIKSLAKSDDWIVI